MEPSYLLGRGKAVFDGELVEALRDGAIRDVVREMSRCLCGRGGWCWVSYGSSENLEYRMKLQLGFRGRRRGAGHSG